MTTCVVKSRPWCVGLSVILGVCLLAVGLPTSAVGQEVIKLRFATGATPDQTIGIGYQKFADLVKEESKGRVQIEMYFSGSLFSETAAIEAVKNGTVDIGSASSGNMGRFTSAFQWMDLPFVLDSPPALLKVLEGPIGSELKARIERELDLKVISFSDNGVRYVFTTKKAVRVPGDLRGLKIRVVPSRADIATWKAWGASPVPVPWPETYTALAQGVVDGEGTGYAWMRTAKHFEVVKYAADVPYNVAGYMAVMKVGRFNSLPPDVQKIILGAGNEAYRYQIKLAAEEQETARKEAVERHGLRTYRPNKEEMEQWVSAARKVWDDFTNIAPPEFLARVRQAQQ